MRRDETLMQYVARPIAKTLEDALGMIRSVDEGIEKNQSINWGITLKGEDKVIGVVGIVRTTPEHHRAEIGYLLAGEHQKKGIISEAITDPRNTASISVLKKLGFNMDGHFRENTLYEGDFLDSMHFSLLARDFKR